MEFDDIKTEMKVSYPLDYNEIKKNPFDWVIVDENQMLPFSVWHSSQSPHFTYKLKESYGT